jgi:hypothetical protein
MCTREGKGAMQKGMYPNIDKEYSIVLLSGDLYKDVSLDNDTIIYSGEGINRHQNYTHNNFAFKKFIDTSKNGNHRCVKVYKKIRSNHWIRLGYYELKSTWIDRENEFNVIKFLLVK